MEKVQKPETENLTIYKISSSHTEKKLFFHYLKDINEEYYFNIANIYEKSLVFEKYPTLVFKMSSSNLR